MARQPVRIAAKGLDRSRRLFNKIRELGGDPRVLLEDWARVIEESTRTRFDTGQGPGGIPWPPSQRVKRDGGKTLFNKGNLESSLRSVVGPGTIEIGFDAIGESSRAAPALHFGFTGSQQVPQHTRTQTSAFGIPITPKEVTVKAHTREQKLPARPILGIDDDDKQDMREVAREQLRELLQDAG